MSSKQVRGGSNYAWPTAEIAALGVGGAANIIVKDQVARPDDPKARQAEPVADYQEKFANPYIAAARGYVDEVNEPRHTREKLIAALDMLKNKRDTNPPKKHGNIPL